MYPLEEPPLMPGYVEEGPTMKPHELPVYSSVPAPASEGARAGGRGQQPVLSSVVAIAGARRAGSRNPSRCACV